MVLLYQTLVLRHNLLVSLNTYQPYVLSPNLRPQVLAVARVRHAPAHRLLARWSRTRVCAAYCKNGIWRIGRALPSSSLSGVGREARTSVDISATNTTTSTFIRKIRRSFMLDLCSAYGRKLHLCEDNGRRP